MASSLDKIEESMDNFRATLQGTLIDAWHSPHEISALSEAIKASKENLNSEIEGCEMLNLHEKSLDDEIEILQLQKRKMIEDFKFLHTTISTLKTSMQELNCIDNEIQ